MIAAGTILAALSLGALVGAQSGAADWAWTDIEPSRTLEWHKCFDCNGQCEGQLDCARLDVPMDWQNPSDDLRVVLAITRMPAVNRTNYLGPVILNPGGTGGSGNYVLRLYGKYIQSVVGDNHDLISFDPRGIGASTPRYQCFDSPEEQNTWDLQQPGIFGAYAGNEADLYVRALAYSQQCERNVRKTGLVEHSGTTYIARDMLEIVNQGTHDNLRFWGFSYGTVIGGVFAAMFPDRVERLLSDANVGYLEWFKGTHRNFLNETEVAMDAFYHHCHKVGPGMCAFYESSPSAIESKLAKLFESLKKSPIIVPASKCAGGPSSPEIITWSKVKTYLRDALYQPYFEWTYFANILEALDKGDGRPFYQWYHPSGYPATPFCGAAVSPFEPLPGMPSGTKDAYPFMRCADRSENGDATLDESVEIINDLLRLSPSTGAANAENVYRCIGRTVKPKWRYDGDFNETTKHPILYVNNIGDAITPMVSAKLNSAGFPGSVVLQQNSLGHTFLAAPSNCTEKHIREYFQTGKLPEEGTQCEGNTEPFWPPV
ncbi:TAP-like protein-domain-containing protein [Plectosphaerella plurivora]|uniref:TAP-like protein-domain-containing protein n=1 Tax=Plectosphaerella plurivora TaxID=936078 RepID=A0A9P9AEF6_9PEZI|nr:TAP-like protein-domain-containing protein [Plectosphaerella plurivora]